MSDSFINSLPTLSQCPKCTGWILECHVDGFRTRVEPNPLNLEEEMKARLEGHEIWQTLGVGENARLIRRTAWHIINGSGCSLVLRGHDCRMPTIFEPAPLFEKPKPKEISF